MIVTKGVEQLDPHRKTLWQFLIKLRTLLSFPYDSDISLLGIYSKEMKTVLLYRLVQECLQPLSWNSNKKKRDIQVSIIKRVEEV